MNKIKGLALATGFITQGALLWAGPASYSPQPDGKSAIRQELLSPTTVEDLKAELRARIAIDNLEVTRLLAEIDTLTVGLVSIVQAVPDPVVVTPPVNP